MDIAASYHDLIEMLVSNAGAPPSLLHVHAGMAIYLGCLLALGTRRGSLAAIVLVVLIAVGNEMMSRLYLNAWDWQGTTRNLLLTLFWPTACYAVSLYRRWSWSEQSRQKARERLLDLYDYRPDGHRRVPAPAEPAE